MRKKIQNKHGMVSKDYSLKITYEAVKRKNGETVNATVSKEAVLSVGERNPSCGIDPYFWRNVLDFQTAAEKIVRLARKLMKQGTHFKISYTVAAYEDVEEFYENTVFGRHLNPGVNQISFNEWVCDTRTDYCGNEMAMERDAEDSEEGGLYFRPNTEYTDGNHDFSVLFKDGFIKSLAESTYLELENEE